MRRRRERRMKKRRKEVKEEVGRLGGTNSVSGDAS